MHIERRQTEQMNTSVCRSDYLPENPEPHQENTALSSAVPELISGVTSVPCSHLAFLKCSVCEFAVHIPSIQSSMLVIPYNWPNSHTVADHPVSSSFRHAF
jgi:hypothetical protein